MAGWLSNLLSSITSTKTRDFILTGDLAAGAPLAPDSYVSVRMLGMRLPNTRDHVVDKIYAVVHGFLTLQRLGESRVTLAAATMPAQLAGVAPDHLDRVISLNNLLAGPTPYVGGDIELQIGLFSVVQENLAATFLTTVTQLSGVIGTGFAAAAAPYVGVLQNAMQMLSNASGHVQLEVGLDDTYAQPATGTFALVATDAGKYDSTKFSVESQTNRLMYNGQPYSDAPYVIFAIESSQQRADWGAIPELATAYSAIRTATTNPARQAALGAFRIAALTSLDLVTADVDRLIALVTARVDALAAATAIVPAPAAFAGFAPMVGLAAPAPGLPELAQLPLYQTD